MPLTPQDVQQKEFAQQFRGYNEIEVDAFLDEVEGELSRLLAENQDLRERLAAAAAAQAAAPPPTAEGEELLQRTLVLAQRTSDETIASARAEAERLLRDARAQADLLLTSAQAEARRTVGDVDERRLALEEHVEGLRAFEREYRSRLTAYLEAQLRDLEARAPAGPAAPGPAALGPAGPRPAAQPAPVLTQPAEATAGPMSSSGAPRDTTVAVEPVAPYGGSDATY